MQKNIKQGDFLFKGVTIVKDTPMKLALIMSEVNFIPFMNKIHRHIIIMVCLSVFLSYRLSLALQLMWYRYFFYKSAVKNFIFYLNMEVLY